jgi:cell division transport system permease protein
MLDSNSLFRIIKTGVVSFWRNIWLSVGATMVMTVTLVIFSMLFLLFSITSYSVKNVQQRVDISVYLKKTLLEDKIQKVKNEIEMFPEVREVEYVPSATVLEEFKQKNQDKPKVIAALNEVSENPFGSTLRVKAKNLEDYPKISEKLSADNFKEYVSEINYDDNREVIQKLGQILKIIISFGSGLVIGLAGIAILVIFNTITLIINNRKEEVEIMRLVGATNWYIRGPFLSESILFKFF